MSKTIVTSAEFTRQFGYLRQSLGDAPVYITHHGRETHVLLTAARYHELTQAPRPGVPESDGMLPGVVELGNWIDHALIILDDTLRIVLANPAAHAMMLKPEGTLNGRVLTEALPEIEGSLVQMYINRALAGREHCSADLPSLFRKDAWVRLEIFPTAGGITILTQDITQDVQHYRLADAKKATIDAMAQHGGIGSIRLNARGLVEQVDETLCAMLKIPQARLTGIGLIDLVPLSRRVALRGQIDQVLGGNGSLHFETEMLANDGEVLSLRCGLVELRGAYAAEGAILIVTRR